MKKILFLIFIVFLVNCVSVFQLDKSIEVGPLEYDVNAKKNANTGNTYQVCSIKNSSNKLINVKFYQVCHSITCSENSGNIFIQPDEEIVIKCPDNDTKHFTNKAKIYFSVVYDESDFKYGRKSGEAIRQ